MPTTSKSSATSGATSKTQPSPTAPHYGTGMAAYVATHGVTAASLSDGEQVYDVATGASFAAFANGLVLSYQKGSDVRDDQPADVAAALWAHLVAARAAQTAAERALAQTTQRLSETQAALAKAEAAAAKATTSAPTPPAPAPATSLQAALQAASPEALAAALVQSIARVLLTAK